MSTTKRKMVCKFCIFLNFVSFSIYLISLTADHNVAEAEVDANGLSLTGKCVLEVRFFQFVAVLLPI